MSRRRAHIAMVGIPAVSHVLPSLEVIRELVARGHRVTYANDPVVAERIEATGAEFVPCGSVLPVADNNWPDDPIEAMGLFLGEAVQALPQLRAVYDDDPADLYLYDIGAYAARALAESQQRPLMQLSPTFVAWKGYEQDVAAHLWDRPGADAYRARFTQWLAGCGASTTAMDSFCGRPANTLALIPRAMQPHGEDVDTDTVTYVGPCVDGPGIGGPGFGGRAGERTWTRPADAERVLLVSLGSAYTNRPEFYRQCLAAYGDLPGWHVVLQIGRHTDRTELGVIPSNVEVHSWVPQLAILEQADAFVTHAGMGGSSEGLLAGVPMIAVPQGADQFMNADRLVELGVARRIDTEDATAETLRTALAELVADPAVARRSARLRTEARAEGGTLRAADLVEELLG
ncbi:macrolide family glycosyltransferase [Streptomyces brevispora]|uniref:Glycosyl transferase n=1 Tax=Streptomyces brevispora TaxID=887462 RepID=A0A561V3Y8_9ACTN|nr:macrolide family glycosyltransferase [Streptomyces brevispora]TWG06335.1 MGT family glycosyltransferase [Streptomyces brevispora]WSC12715.1 glycosyl transferase [Streptomyces brevispora]